MLFIKYLLITLLFDLIVNEDDNNNIYCGQKEIKLNPPLSILYPKINNQYGKDNLYCEYNLYNSGIQTKKIKLKIEKFFKDIEISYTIKYKNKNYEDVIETITLKNNNMNSNNNYNKVLYLNFYISSNKTFDSLPFLIEITNINSIKQFYILLSLFIFFLCCIIIALIKYFFCSKKNDNIYENEEHLADKVEADIKIKSCKIMLKKIYNDDKYFIHDIFNQKYSDYGIICSICQENFKNNKDTISITPCEHIFHNDCLKNWFKKNILHPKCPNCNLNMLEVEKINDNNVNIKVINVKSKKKREINTMTSKNNLMHGETNNKMNNDNKIDDNNIENNKQNINDDDYKDTDNNIINSTMNIIIKNKKIKNDGFNLNNNYQINSATDRALNQDINNSVRSAFNNNNQIIINNLD